MWCVSSMFEREYLSVPKGGSREIPNSWLRSFARNGGKLVLGATVLRLEPDALVFEKDGQEQRLVDAAMVITALGASPQNALFEIAEEIGIPCQVVGDAQAPRRLLEAVHEGDAVGRAI